MYIYLYICSIASCRLVNPGCEMFRFSLAPCKIGVFFSLVVQKLFHENKFPESVSGDRYSYSFLTLSSLLFLWTESKKGKRWGCNSSACCSVRYSATRLTFHLLSFSSKKSFGPLPPPPPPIQNVSVGMRIVVVVVVVAVFLVLFCFPFKFSWLVADNTAQSDERKWFSLLLSTVEALQANPLLHHLRRSSFSFLLHLQRQCFLQRCNAAQALLCYFLGQTEPQISERFSNFFSDSWKHD